MASEPGAIVTSPADPVLIVSPVGVVPVPIVTFWKGVPVTVTPVMSGVPPPVRSVFITLEKSMPDGPRPEGLARNVLPIIDPGG